MTDKELEIQLSLGTANLNDLSIIRLYEIRDLKVLELLACAVIEQLKKASSTSVPHDMPAKAHALIHRRDELSDELVKELKAAIDIFYAPYKWKSKNCWPGEII